MTAPDPGLTDLIAADLAKHLFIPDEGDDEFGSCSCLTWRGPNHDRHVALVVEQHTNGRHVWPKTTPTGHTYERPTTYDELNGITADMAQGEIEGWEKTELPPEPTWPMVTLAQREIYRQSVRIAELKATIARVRAVLPHYFAEPGGKATAEQIAWLDGTKHVQRQLRAALEGEQQ